MKTSSNIYISKSALENNVRFIQSLVGQDVRVSSVVKANAYGHGLHTTIPVIENCGIDHFSVFDFDEAAELKSLVSENTDIMIMGYIPENRLEESIQFEFEFFVFNIDRLEESLRISKQLGVPAKIHLEVETGMNRTGLNSEELEEAISIIKENRDQFIVKGFCTHLAGAESIANYVRIQEQLNKFKSYRALIIRNGIEPEYCHAACSASLIGYPDAHFDLVRVGILQYGFWPSKESFIQYIHDKEDKSDPLKRAISWKTYVMEISKVQMGEFVGYGTSYLAQEDKAIAIIPIGYSNGYRRSFGNQGRVIINGQRCGVIGMVNMNMIAVDVTFVPELKIGDEVIIIGEQQGLEISVSSFGEISNMVNYELLSRLPINIKRILVS